jgi:hypothetical protein
MVDVSKMPVAVIESDECDGNRLVVYPLGNGDWYAEVAPTGQPDQGYRPSIRFCTSGTMLGKIPLIMNILYRVATEQHEDAALLADLLAKELKEKLERSKAADSS